MPFYPSELVFHLGDVSFVVDFYDKANAKIPWSVSAAKIAGYNAQKRFWKFEPVGPHPDPAKKDSWMQGTLKFTATKTSDDPWLDANWPKDSTAPDGTLELTVSCNYQPRSLTVKLRA